MNAISRPTYPNHDAVAAYSSRPTEETIGLGPNQLTWLRRNVDGFKELEELRHQVRQDTLRAARMAGLI